MLVTGSIILPRGCNARGSIVPHRDLVILKKATLRLLLYYYVLRELLRTSQIGVNVWNDVKPSSTWRLQHLELSHPENGESPFIARDASPLGQRKRSTSNASSRSPAGRGSRSNSLAPTSEHADGDFYVECPLRCGEAVHIRELEDHMDLHDIESQGFDEIDGAGSSRHTSPVPFGRRSSSMGRSILDTSFERRPSRSMSPAANAFGLTEHYAES